MSSLFPYSVATTVAIWKRRALREGVFGGSWWWRFVAFVVFVIPFLRRVAGSGSEVLLVEELRPGDTMVVRPLAPTPRRSRRRSRRAARRAR